jgi:hypothetical protein
MNLFTILAIKERESQFVSALPIAEGPTYRTREIVFLLEPGFLGQPFSLPE